MNIKKYFFNLFIISGLLSVISLSCYSDYGMSTKDFDVVISARDNNINFQKFSTYAMPDSVVRMTEDNSKPNTSFDATILKEVERQMSVYGYTRVAADPNNLPDVIVLVGVTSSDNYAGGGWGGWWGWYPGWPGYYPPGWGPGWGYVYSYTTGTLLITMIDPADFNPDNKTVNVCWSGALNGVLESSDANNASRIIEGINKIFEQSPYLNTYK
jgi:hypothetical protein